MTCGTFIVRNVPADKLQLRMDLYKKNDPPPTSVTSAADGNGTYTITAVFPPCPENTTHGPTEKKP